MEECHRMLTNQVDLVNPEGHRLVPDVSKTLPLGGPPGHVTIQSQFFFNKDLEYLVSGDKGRRLKLSISKLKEAQYLDFGLEELVPSLWIKSEREYDISAAYGISYWWFKYKEFYIIRHSAPRILSVVSLKTYERYGYPFLKEIVLRIADYKEYKISKADFKNLHSNDFKDLYLLHLQEDLQLGVESYQTKLNLTQPDWDARSPLLKTKLKKSLLDFDSNQEKRLSYLRTQLEQQQDDMIGKINLPFENLKRSEEIKEQGKEEDGMETDMEVEEVIEEEESKFKTDEEVEEVFEEEEEKKKL
ncbi:hypothetical protein Tco_0770651 [Tanacetum coccineum]|uniref:Uncharacterized protein n=1 Tax=Tanacetum coccineum TaxID=301880 RepID=A0ABQ4ZG68_9ASTR